MEKKIFFSQKSKFFSSIERSIDENMINIVSWYILIHHVQRFNIFEAKICVQTSPFSADNFARIFVFEVIKLV